MCLVDGTMSIILVPHVFRQEVSGGATHNTMFHEYEKPKDFQHIANAVGAVNGSPINFFDPDIKKYP